MFALAIPLMTFVFSLLPLVSVEVIKCIAITICSCDGVSKLLRNKLSKAEQYIINSYSGADSPTELLWSTCVCLLAIFETFFLLLQSCRNVRLQ